jgi:hypothetical protein
MLPTVIVIGAMKGGTSSLHRYLNAHPEICMSRTKETNFFIRKGDVERDESYYDRQFRGGRWRRVRHYGESSPNYTKWPAVEAVPERMHRLVPQAKLVYVVRDPIERMISHYGHSVAAGRERRPLDEALSPRYRQRYLDPSRYRTQIERFLEYYPLDQMLVVSSEELRQERRATLARVFRFLQVDDSFESPTFATEFHRTHNKFRDSQPTSWGTRLIATLGLKPLPEKPTVPRRELSAECRSGLEEVLAPECDALRSLTGQRFEAWCI